MEPTVARLLSSGVTVVLGIVSYHVWRKSRNSLPIPPGPKGWPLIGNLLQLPAEQEWVTYHEWCQALGTDILYINAAGNDIVILNSVEAIAAVMDQNGALCSNRPRLPMVRELIGWDAGFQFKDYTDTMRLYRKMFHQEMGPTGAPRMRSHQVRATHRFLKRLMSDIDSEGVNVVEECRNMSGEIVIAVTYGFELSSETQHYVQMSKEAIDPVVEALTPGAFMVDVFPFLKHVPSWFPGASFKRKAQVWSDMRQQMFDKTFEHVKRRMAAGISAPCFVSYSLSNIDPTSNVQEIEECIKTVAGSMYGAGGDTTLAVVSTAIHIFLNNPEAVKRAQKELDEVIGFGNLPTFDDELSLPFTRSFIMEILRWKAPIPLGLPHVSTADIIYKGYRIPKGSIVLGNAWGPLYNEEIFKDPHPFKPGRFLTSDGRSIDPSIPDPSTFVFGYGRRTCPGKWIADASLWIILSSLLAVFDFHRVDDAGGPDHKYQPGVLNIPKEFKARFEPRSEAIRRLIYEFHDV